MQFRWKTAIALVLLAAFSAWLLEALVGNEKTKSMAREHHPDYYMKNFITTTMEEDGTVKNKLIADYMAHYVDDDTTELLNPRLEVFRKEKTPVIIVAEKGWVTADNEVILLSGDVTLWQNNEDGSRKLQINTKDVKVLTEQEYAETDMPATLVGNRTTINSTGVRAYFKESRIELLHNVHTTIKPENSD